LSVPNPQVAVCHNQEKVAVVKQLLQVDAKSPLVGVNYDPW